MKKQHEYWHPPSYDQHDVRAVQALHDGEATPDEQQRFLRWVVEQAAMTYDEPFRPDAPDIVAYMLGRRSVGLAVIKLMKLSQEVFEDRGERDFRDDDGRGRSEGRRDGRRPDRRDRHDDNRRQRPRDNEDYREV